MKFSSFKELYRYLIEQQTLDKEVASQILRKILDLLSKSPGNPGK